MRALLDKVFLAACSSHLGPFLACQVSVESSAVILMLLPRDLLSLAPLRIFSLFLEFASFTIKCQGIERFLLILEGGDTSLSPGSEYLFPFPI